MNNSVPRHIGIIMDGNGRWAQEKGLNRSNGHAMGYVNLRKLATYILSKNVEILSVYAFSTENFKRDQAEVDYLMNLFVEKFSKEKNYFNKKNVKVIFSGRKEPLRQDVYDSMMELIDITKNNTGGIFNICLNYSGQAEIVDACKKICNEVTNNQLDVNTLDEKMFYKYMYNDLPPVDFVIRTSGEKRISNFLLYQSSYAEYYFPTIYFPDFNNKEFDKALEEYQKRDRRFGKNSKK